MAALCFVVSLVASTGTASAERRAFVVGNSDYQYASVLPNPGNDATAIASALKQMGYRVTLGLDLSRRSFLRKFSEFNRSLEPTDLALFYFAGHGIQLDGENYLFPVDGDVQGEADARKKLVSLNSLISDLSRSVESRIVILDACRNNPFVPQLERSLKVRAGGLSRGLARVYAGVGSFIAFSTQPGNVALDGAGSNSPFTTSLLRHIQKPQTDVHGVMRKVRADVRRATIGKQVPWENSSLIEEVSFSSGILTRDVASTPDKIVGERFHYVGGLDPLGDNFLALKNGPGVKFPRLGTMGPNTLLKVVGSRGKWKQVELTDGARGWAHGDWIKCCKTITRQSLIARKPVTGGDEMSCDSLWYARNEIWHRHRYCFKGARGQTAFGNAGCTRTREQAHAAMSARTRAAVSRLAAREKQLGCR